VPSHEDKWYPICFDLIPVPSARDFPFSIGENERCVEIVGEIVASTWETGVALNVNDLLEVDPYAVSFTQPTHSSPSAFVDKVRVDVQGDGPMSYVMNVQTDTELGASGPVFVRLFARTRVLPGTKGTDDPSPVT